MTEFITGESLTYLRAELTFHWFSDVMMSGVYKAFKAIGEPILALHYTDGTIEIGTYEPELKEDDSVFRLTTIVQEQR